MRTPRTSERARERRRDAARRRVEHTRFLCLLVATATLAAQQPLRVEAQTEPLLLEFLDRARWPFPALLQDPKSTVDYDDALAERIEHRVAEMGADGYAASPDEAVRLGGRLVGLPLHQTDE